MLKELAIPAENAMLVPTYMIGRAEGLVFAKPIEEFKLMDESHATSNHGNVVVTLEIKKVQPHKK